jgi:c-di-GMP-related signal transduction protein
MPSPGFCRPHGLFKPELSRPLNTLRWVRRFKSFPKVADDNPEGLMSTPGQAVSAKNPGPCLARQPILTKDEKVVGYELLSRESPEEHRFTSNPESATSHVIDTLNVLGLDVVCDGHAAFINCTRQMLVNESLFLLPADKVVVEIQPDAAPDEAVLQASQHLKKAGYRIALDNFVPNDLRQALLPYSDFVKVDIRWLTPEQRSGVAARRADKRFAMLAHKVETRQQFLTAVGEGFTLFQGYFFHHPEQMRARHIPVNQASHLKLLKAVSQPGVDLAAVEDLIKHDASLCYRLLRYLNSPLLGISSPVQSIRHAMTLLGERELIRWIRMATTLLMGQEKCSDLILSSLVRARFCELIGPKLGQFKLDLFLIGMLSLMDAILDVPMGVVVEGLGFDPATKEDLLGAKIGKDTALFPLYHLMVAREGGDWEEVTAQAKRLNLSLPFVNRAYHEAMQWGHQMTSAVPA